MIFNTINPFLRFHQSEIYHFFFSPFNAHWCSKSTLSKSWRGRCILGWYIVRLVRYIGSYGISPFSPPMEISSLSPPKKWIESSKTWSVKCNEVQLDRFFGFLGRGYPDYYFKFRIIYGWLDWTNKIKYPGSV